VLPSKHTKTTAMVVSRMFDTCSSSCVSCDTLQCRLLERLLDHPVSRAASGHKRAAGEASAAGMPRGDGGGWRDEAARLGALLGRHLAASADKLGQAAKTWAASQPMGACVRAWIDGWILEMDGRMEGWRHRHIGMQTDIRLRTRIYTPSQTDRSMDL